jgi:hypothetical protein
MKRLLGALALAASAALAATPVWAATSFVQDGAGMFSADAVAQVNGRLSAFNAQTKKEVVVITVPALPAGQNVQQAADAAFAAQNVDGTLIYIARDDHKIYVQADRAASTAGWITSATATSIASDVGGQFKAGDMDGGLTTGVNDVLNIYRSHLGSVGQTSTSSSNSASYGGSSSGGIHFQMWWIIVAVVGFFILRSVMRPRYYGPPGGGVAPGAPGGMPMGYGGGYGGGGSGFWSGLVGGLGGAWLGNEMFGRGGGGGMLGGGGGTDGGSGTPGDSGGWTSDAGQTGAGGGSDWGGGGWGGGDSGGGGGDFGGGGGGDSGGGGGGW